MKKLFLLFAFSNTSTTQASTVPALLRFNNELIQLTEMLEETKEMSLLMKSMKLTPLEEEANSYIKKLSMEQPRQEDVDEAKQFVISNRAALPYTIKHDLYLASAAAKSKLALQGPSPSSIKLAESQEKPSLASLEEEANSYIKKLSMEQPRQEDVDEAKQFVISNRAVLPYTIKHKLYLASAAAKSKL